MRIMKNIKKYFGLTLIALLFSVVFSACEDKDEVGSDNVALGIKVFSPTKVVPGQPVTINGSGFGEVTEVVFPGGIAVKNFELVSNEMIRVVTPSGINIAAEGEKLIVRTDKNEAESPRLMTQGNTQPRAYSAEPGDDVKAKSVLKIFGQDMEFVNKVTFTGKDDQPIVLQSKDFYRIATNSLSIKVPTDVKEGLQIGTYETMDGKHFELPEFNYVAAATGHWETTKTIIWENNGAAGAISWSGDYRFSNEETSTGEEIYAIPMDQWNDIIKGGEFKVDIEGGDPQIRVTTGWWSTTWTGDDIFPGNERLVDNEDGTMTLTVNLSGDPILDVLDAQHLLFTGDRYTVLRIYTEESVWVEDAEGHWERKYLWKNDGSVGDINWSGNYRFSNVETSTGEEVYAFPMEDWDIIKNGDFKVEIEGGSPQIRVTTGWWSTTWKGDDIFPGNELLEDNGDGTYVLSVNLAGDPILDVLDAQHLLFTGSGYKVNSIFVDVWVEEGDGPKPVTIWENDGSKGGINWSSDYRFSNEETKTGEEIYAIPMDQWDVIKNGTFYLTLEGDAPQIRVTTGWWSTTWGGDDIFAGNDHLVDNGDGTWTLEVNLSGDPILDVLDAQHLLFTGSGYTPLKLFYKK